MSPEYPATPWVRGTGRERECLYQEGDCVPLVLADPSRQMGEDEVDGLLDRIVTCVEALDGIDDPAGFVLAARRVALTAIIALAPSTEPAERRQARHFHAHALEQLARIAMDDVSAATAELARLATARRAADIRTDAGMPAP